MAWRGLGPVHLDLVAIIFPSLPTVTVTPQTTIQNGFRTADTQPGSSPCGQQGQNFC